MSPDDLSGKLQSPEDSVPILPPGPSAGGPAETPIDGVANTPEGDGEPVLAEEARRESTTAWHGGPLPERIGSYTILGILGQGGQGVVYLAEQEKPRRQVALKVIPPEKVSPALLRRFEYEGE